MRQELNTAYGFYRPSFFRIHIERGDDYENLNLLDDVPLAIFFHEYVHFLQDITTVAGLSNISNIVDYMKYCNTKILSTAEKAFKIPIVPTANQVDNVFINTQLRRSYLGDASSSTFSHIESVELIPTEFTDDRQKLKTKRVKITYRLANGDQATYYLGNTCVMENMAYYCESMLFPNILQEPPAVPYTMAEQVLAFVYPEFPMSKINVIALCDATLCMFDVGLFFYEMCIAMKEQRFIPKREEDIYDFCYSQPEIDFHGSTDLKQFAAKIGSEAINQMSEFFKSDFYKGNQLWVSYTIEQGMNLRLGNPYFILNIVRGGPLKENVEFKKIFTTVGMPLTTNQNDVLRFYSPKQDEYEIKPDSLWAVNQVFNIYVNSKRGDPVKRCEMKMYCRDGCAIQEIPDFTDERCYPNPWERSSDEQVCSFGAIWKSWGLTEYYPVE